MRAATFLFQLQFPESPDLLVLAFGDGRQRKNFQPVDQMFARDFSSTVISCQLQHLVGGTQPMSGGKFTLFDSLEEFAQKRPNTQQQNLQMLQVLAFVLGHGSQ